ncbi:hypothetical protein PhCBS80983_g04560 [Powellomyces hirtus]|uniref:GRIP domain-containing protein n=1 Tax=Powellomyces hirtus TaxID=109895 RepID=A0A507DZY9_9FUNG|nr:hypothetical protein PhCBS80983_g04560 [Powellomyces hirtus]
MANWFDANKLSGSLGSLASKVQTIAGNALTDSQQQQQHQQSTYNNHFHQSLPQDPVGWDVHSDDEGNGGRPKDVRRGDGLEEKYERLQKEMAAQLSQRDTHIQELEVRLAQQQQQILSRPVTQPGSPIPGASDAEMVPALRKKLGTAVHHLKHLSAENSTLSQRVAGADAAVAAKDAEISALKARLEEMASHEPSPQQSHTDNHDDAHLVDELRTRMVDVEGQLGQSLAREAELNKELATARESAAHKISELEQRCAELVRAREATEAPGHAAGKSMELLTDDLKRLSLEREDSRSTLGAMQQNIELLEERVQQLTQELGQIQSENKELGDEREQLKRDLASAAPSATNAADLEKLQADKEAENADFKRQLDVLSSENARLAEQLQEATTGLDELQVLSKTAQQLTEDKEALVAEKTSQRAHTEQLMDTLANLTQENERLAARSADNEASAAGLAAQLEKIRTENELLVEQARQYERQRGAAATMQPNTEVGAAPPENTEHNRLPPPTSSAGSSDGWDVEDDMGDFDWGPPPPAVVSLVPQQQPQPPPPPAQTPLSNNDNNNLELELKQQVKEKDALMDVLQHKLDELEAERESERLSHQAHQASAAEHARDAERLRDLAARESQLQDELSTLRQANDTLYKQLSSTIETSQSRIQELGDEVAQLQVELAAAKRLHQQQEQQDVSASTLAESAAIVADLEAKIASLQHQLDESDIMLEEEARVHQDQVAEMVAAYKQQQTDDAKKIKALENHLAEMKTQASAHAEAGDAMICEARDRIANLEAEIEHYRKTIAEQTSTSTPVADGAKQLESDDNDVLESIVILLDTLIGTRAEPHGDTASPSIPPPAVTDRINILGGMVTDLKAQIVDREARLEQATRQVDAVKADIERTVQQVKTDCDRRVEEAAAATTDAAAVSSLQSQSSVVGDTDLQAKYDQASEAVRRLTGEKQMLMDRLTTMKNAFAPKLQAEMETSNQLRSEIVQLQTTITAIQEAYDHQTTERTRLELAVSTSDETIGRLQSDLTRLRQHLMETEDAQLAHATQTEEQLTTFTNRIAQLERSLAQTEEQAARDRDAARVASDRADQLFDECEELKLDVQKVQLEKEREMHAVENLMRVLAEFQDAKQRDLDAAVASLKADNDRLAAAVQDWKQRAEAAASHQQAQHQPAAELAAKTQLIGKLRHDVHTLQQHLAEALRRLHDMTASGDLVDRQVAANLLVGFLELPRGDKRRYDVLNVLASYLRLEDTDRVKIGLARPARAGPFAGILGGGGAGAKTEQQAVGESFTDMWISFLLKESSRHDMGTNAASPAANGAVGGPPPPAMESRRQSVVGISPIAQHSSSLQQPHSDHHHHHHQHHIDTHPQQSHHPHQQQHHPQHISAHAQAHPWQQHHHQQQQQQQQQPDSTPLSASSSSPPAPATTNADANVRPPPTPAHGSPPGLGKKMDDKMA